MCLCRLTAAATGVARYSYEAYLCLPPLQDQNVILSQWLQHIESAGDDAPAAAATILECIRQQDAAQIAAAAVQQMQVG